MCERAWARGILGNFGLLAQLGSKSVSINDGEKLKARTQIENVRMTRGEMTKLVQLKVGYNAKRNWRVAFSNSNVKIKKPTNNRTSVKAKNRPRPPEALKALLILSMTLSLQDGHLYSPPGLFGLHASTSSHLKPSATVGNPQHPNAFSASSLVLL